MKCNEIMTKRKRKKSLPQPGFEPTPGTPDCSASRKAEHVQRVRPLGHTVTLDSMADFTLIMV